MKKSKGHSIITNGNSHSSKSGHTSASAVGSNNQPESEESNISRPSRAERRVSSSQKLRKSHPYVGGRMFGSLDDDDADPDYYDYYDVDADYSIHDDEYDEEKDQSEELEEGGGSEDELDEEYETEEEETEEEESRKKASRKTASMISKTESEISIEEFTKEELILIYLDLMKRLKKLKSHNVYIQSYLYQLCERKKLLTADEVTKIWQGSGKLDKKFKKELRKNTLLPARNAKFDAFRAIIPERKPSFMTKPTRGALKRARFKIKPDRIPPQFIKKLDTKVVRIHGKLYQRVLRSKTRDWRQDILEQGDVPLMKQQLMVHDRPVLVEIPQGHPSLPKKYQRTIVPYEGITRGKTKIARRRARQNMKPTYPIYNPKYEFRNIGSKKRMTKKFYSLMPGSTGYKPPTITIPGSESTFPGGGGETCSVETVSSNPFFRSLEKRLASSARTRGPHHNEKPNKDHHGGDHREKPRASVQPHHDSIVRASDIIWKQWDEVIWRLFDLLEQHAHTQKRYEKSIKKKTQEWTDWEKQDVSAVQHMFRIFKTFVMHHNFSPAESVEFRKQVAQFGENFHRAHSSLMVQIYRMHRARLNLFLLQRELKYRTNQETHHQGFSIVDYELRFNENKQLSEKLAKKEKEAEDQSFKLRSIIRQLEKTQKNVVTQRKHICEAAAVYEKRSTDANTARNAAAGAMEKYRKQMNENKDFLQSAVLVEKPHLLRDYTTKKKALQYFELEVQKRNLTQQVIQREKEFNILKVKSHVLEMDLHDRKQLAAKQRMEQLKREHFLRTGGNVYTALANCQVSSYPKRLELKKSSDYYFEE